MTPTVTILTYCAHPALAYGTMLVFKTLRTGFPTARIEIYDNGSHPEVREQIMMACAEVDADFTAMEPRHWVEHYRWLLLEREHDGSPLVVLDPDVALWENVEGWDFGDALMAGRLMREAQEGPITSHPRLHPSMLWIPDVQRLRARLDPGDIAPQLMAEGGRVHFWDTLAVAYQRNAAECAAFEAEHLDCYDHLFFGAHLPLIDALAGESLDAIRAGHRAVAAGDLAAFRGAWRAQEEAFNRPRVAGVPQDVAAAQAAMPGRILASLREIQDRQGLGYTDDELRAALASLQSRMRPSA